ncbi:helix-turn-helix domain-containing protein [Defluviimonas sp. D31]|uniref:helix-turn-helix transcriptional regulator n=1 Tax=Defluviimonas sp. D31 TaxID=3083253 RepID=UPI00296E8D78|nr:helix-turn-helix domain-containing protein [Defluviimonas sp. D31]MDW4549834.1 helix-turn-helix domain-containing protein [Defluviimonas sp. D31]
MTVAHRFDTDLLRRQLLDRLGSFTRPRDHGMHAHAERLFSYCTLARERIAAIRLDHPLLGIVLKGSKEVWLGESCEVQVPGTVFVLPRGVALDVVNIPDDRSGYYESLIFEVAALPPGIAPDPAVPEPPASSFRVALTHDLVEALAHAATSIADPASRDSVKTLRLAEVLALLRGAPAARSLFAAGLGDRLAWRIAEAPDMAWTAGALAAELGLGASTLRRRLAAEGTSFRTILEAVRMRAAERMIAAGASSLAAAEAAGYRSRSHFARAYRRQHGTSPSGQPPRADRAQRGNLS